jgi:hypothetical protein
MFDSSILFSKRANVDCTYFLYLLFNWKLMRLMRNSLEELIECDGKKVAPSWHSFASVLRGKAIEKCQF